MTEPTIDELLGSYRTLDPKDAYVVHRLGSEIERLRAENKIAVEALERIEKDYSGAMEIAANALARIRKMGGET